MIMKLAVILSFIGLTIGAPTTINTDNRNLAEEVAKTIVDEATMIVKTEEQIAEAEIKAVVDAGVAISTGVKELAEKQSDVHVAEEISKAIALSVMPLAAPVVLYPKESLKAAEAAVEMFFVPIGVPLSVLRKQAEDGKISGEALAKIENGVAQSVAAVAAGVSPVGAIPLSNLIYHTAEDIQKDIKKIETNDDAAAKALKVLKVAAPIVSPFGGFVSLFL